MYPAKNLIIVEHLYPRSRVDEEGHGISGRVVSSYSRRPIVNMSQRVSYLGVMTHRHDYTEYQKIFIEKGPLKDAPRISTDGL